MEKGRAASHKLMERAAKRRVLAGAARASLLPGQNTGSVHRVAVELAADAGQVPEQKAVYNCSYRERQKWLKENCREVLLPLLDGSDFHWTVSDPFAVLGTMARLVPAQKDILLSCLREGQDLPIAVYTDEVVPGNPLQPDPERRTWGIYVTVLTAGAERLRSPKSCFLLLAQRCFVLWQLEQRLDRRLLPALAQLQQQHHTAYGNCYGRHKPKHHFSLHQTRR